MKIKTAILFLAVAAFTNLAKAQEPSFIYDNQIEDAALSEAVVHWQDINSHVVWVQTPMRMTLEGLSFVDGTRGVATVLYSSNSLIEADRDRPDGLGLAPNIAYPHGYLLTLGAPQGAGSAFDGKIEISTAKDWDLSQPIDQAPTELGRTMLHEYLHLLGLSSGFFSDTGAYFNDSPDGLIPTIYDRFLFRNGQYATEMDNEGRLALFSRDLPVYFKGEKTALYGDALYTQAVDASIGVELDESLSHISADVQPRPIFSTGTRTTENHAFLAAAMLSDLGLGDTLDTSIALVESEQGINLAIRTNTLQTDVSTVGSVILRLTGQSGANLALNAGDATCATEGENTLVCALDDYPVNTDILLSFDATGTEGVYPVSMRIDHNAPHVDGQPFNNRLASTVSVGSNPLSALSLDTDSIDEGAAAGTQIGTVSAANSGDSAVTYSLITGAGDTGNSLVSLTEAGVLTVAGTLDHESRAQLPIRVQALTANGFSTVEQLVVLINDTAADGCLNNVVAHMSHITFPLINSAYAGNGEVAAVGMLPVLLQIGLWFVSLFAGSRVRRSTKLNRGWKIAILAGLAITLVACGGGGDASVAPSPQSC